MAQADDKTLIRRFSGILIGLIIVTVAIIVLAVSFQSPDDPTANPSQLALAEERIAPVAAVRTGDTQLPEVVPEVSASAAPFDGSLDGELVYNNVCSACHTTGAAGAPMPGEGMAERAEKGLDTLVHNAIAGINLMPPKGGNADLTDEQVRAAVEHMLQQ